MGAFPGIEAHPHQVVIPDPALSGGLRAYREPPMPHPLQQAFLDVEGERAWVEEMRNLLCAGRSIEADARLAADLDGFDGTLARLCKATPADAVSVDGWDDLLPVLAEWEGPAITAITLGLTNAPDLVFEAGRLHEPELLLGLYSDEGFPFSATSNADLLTECGKEMPGWAGAEEDVEFHCTLSGLAELNTALIQCKHRHFLRDGRDGVEGRAPGGYVEFVLASWLLATRFLQAAERAVARHGLPAGCRLIAGAVDVNADFVSILGSARPATRAARPRSAEHQPEFAPLTMKPWVPRDDLVGEGAASGPSLRQRLAPVASAPVSPPRAGFLARLLDRFKRG